ncbi:diguanylate cyclase [Legionella maioricensis]|uniref:diguanylate cyclase n=1 Tax=Legionella maioricensis TaxID=2896528 RepID=A0A9X2D1N4_9GAMM|nr:diguanylate cyclase [Legionella maioricensis]MCL9684543.1 diguanylate cyclase [Legionella maioricensis]MCL9687863.1 diguanylate cyclase [Legionella maioricensis]
MQINALNREELQEIIFQLEQALYNHQQWYNLIIRSLVCRLPASRYDTDSNAHKECRFGQWYYENAPEKLRKNPGFIALGEEHQLLHKVTSQLLVTTSNGGTVSPHDYDNFANVLERMRLEIAVLQREMGELIYNRDSLTGAINRISLLPVLREQQALVKRNVQACSIAMLDLDHFKQVNDQYGHPAGDCVLAGISRFIIENIRSYDKFFRIGGEEFLICFQNADTKLAFEMVERLRRGVSELNINVNDNQLIKITASFGIAPIGSDISVEQSIENADKALYKAKDGGRNNTKIWS